MTQEAKAPARRGGPPKMDPPDLTEKGGVKEGVQQTSDRRLFMQLQAFGGATDPAPLAKVLADAGLQGVLYQELGDPRGVAVLTYSQSEDHFVDTVGPVLRSGPFAELEQKHEYSMFGRTYALGYEPNLEDWLLHKPLRNVHDEKMPWAVWYPLRRKGEFATLPEDEQKSVLREHGTIGMQWGQSGLAHDVRLACHGLDKNDNDFVIGLIGGKLHPLSALVERMRKTRQTSTLMENMGPFFVGKAVWRSEAPA
jgi:chlorite dismutase